MRPLGKRLCGLAALLVLSSPLAGRAPAAGRPNVVLIYTDDQDLDEIGCYGGRMPTPHMDGLARDGMKFTRFYVCSAVCSPSRYNVLSGRCASRSLRQQGKKYPPGGPVNIGWEAGLVGEPHGLAGVLKAAGYVTGMVGKWHQGALKPTPKFPPDADPEDPKVCKQLAANYEVLVESVKSCGFDYAGAVYANNVDGARPNAPHWIPPRLAFHNMEWVTAEALRFLEANRDRPFFLYLALTLVHSPSALKSLKSDPRTTPAGYVEVPKVQPPRESVLERARAEGGRMDDKAAGSVWLDDGVGSVLKKINELGLAGNTLVMLAGDNGNVAKFTCYDGGGLMPFVARWKGVVPAGAVCDRLVSNLDFAPTLFELCGAAPPPDMILDGRSMLPALKGDPSYRRESLFLEITTERAVVTDDGFKYVAVRYLPGVEEQVRQGKKFNHWCQPIEEATHTYNADRRYPAYFDRDQLYDLKDDPGEQRNLAADPRHRDRLDRMKSLLREYSASLPHTFGEFKSR